MLVEPLYGGKPGPHGRRCGRLFCLSEHRQPLGGVGEIQDPHGGGAVEDEAFAALGAQPTAMVPSRTERHMTDGTLRRCRWGSRPGGRGTLEGQILNHLGTQDRKARIQGLLDLGQGNGGMLGAPILHAGNDVQTTDGPLLGGVVTAHEKSSTSQDYAGSLAWGEREIKGFAAKI